MPTSYADFVDPFHSEAAEISESEKRADAKFKKENHKGILPGEIVIMVDFQAGA